MKTPRKKLFTVRSDAEWRAVNSPVRVEMLVFMLMAGPCAIRELSSWLQRPADGLYHHLRQLLKAGLVTDVGSRKVGTQTETLYQTVAEEITIDRDLSRARTRERSLRLFQTMLKHAWRTVEAAVGSGSAVLEGSKQNFRFNWRISWLDHRQLAEIRRHQEVIDRILQEGMQKRQGQLIAHLTYLSPVVRTRGARSLHDEECDT